MWGDGLAPPQIELLPLVPVASLALSHWQRQDRTTAATRGGDLHVEEVIDRIEQALGDVIAIVHVEPAAAMLHGDEGVRRALAARLNDELVREVDRASLANRLIV